MKNLRFVVVMLLLPCLAMAQDKQAAKPDFDKMDADTLKLMAEQYWRAANSCIENVEKLKAKVDKLVGEVAKAKTDAITRDEEIKTLKTELEKWKPISVNAKDSDGMPNITVTQLNTMGEKYVHGRVRMIIAFRSAQQTWIEELQMSGELYKNYVGFTGYDKRGELGQRFYANKKDCGELLAEIKVNTTILIEGYVVDLRHAPWYGVICDKIQKVASDPQ